jgi:intein/homing endonuclease
MSSIFESLLNDFIGMAEGVKKNEGLWREDPVDLLTFFKSKDFLGERPYPGKQTELLEVVGSILWWKLTGEEDACPHNLKEVTEVVAMLGKGSGKDFLASGILAYMCYLLCSMNDPHTYFGFGQDEPIDLINVAINANQANNVFFKKLKARLNSCKWFNKVSYNPAEHASATPKDFQFTKSQIRFYKNITAHSAHSEADSFEGFNPLMVIFDEIGGFELEKAEECYKTLRSSAVSRYNNKMFLMFISFPRSMGDYMMTKYNEATEKKDPQVYAMRGKSWEVNPKISRESLDKDYVTDPEGSKMKYESLTGDTLIYTPEGAFRIDELGDNSLIRTMFGAREVQQFINSGTKSVYELRTKEGYIIRGSANHPLKVYANKHNWKESSGFVWRTIGELRKGDKVYLDLGNELFGEETISKEMALLTGALIADGSFGCRSINGRGYATWYFEKDSELIELYTSAFIKEFEINPCESSPDSREDIVLRTDRQDIIQKFLDIGLEYGDVYTKKIPISIFRQPKEIIVEFLKGLFDADGHVLKAEGTPSLFTCNNNLAKQVQQLLIMLGIRSRLWYRPARKGKIDSKEGWVVALSKQESVVFNNLIELNISYKRESQQKCKSWDDCENYKYQLPYCTVKEVVYTGEEECYDLWVEPENEFTANGMVAHNCIPPAYRDGLFQFPDRIDQCVEIGKCSQCPGLLVQEKITTRTLHTGEERHFVGLEIYNLVLDPSFTYYLGGDGGVTTDSYIITLYHGEPSTMEVVENNEVIIKTFNKPVEDLILEWRPSKKDRLPVDLVNVADVLEMICKQVFVKKALFDKFNSAEVVQRLMMFGVEAEDKNWSNPFQLQLYSNLKALIYTNQISFLDYRSIYDGIYPNLIPPNEELKALKIINGNKIDHDSDKAKDFSDARVAASWICSMDEPDEQEHCAMPSILGAKRKG